MLEELLEHLRDPGGDPKKVIGALRSISWQDDDLDVEIRVMNEEGAVTDWRVRCSDVAEYRFVAARGDISFHEFGHVAARQHTHRTDALLFRNRPASIDACIGALWLAHQSVAGPWIPFLRYLNSSVPLGALLEAGNGVLATGPHFLLQAYADAIEGMGTGAYFRSEHPSGDDPVRWRQDEDHQLGTFVVGAAFVVALRFEATRLAAVK